MNKWEIAQEKQPAILSMPSVISMDIEFQNMDLKVPKLGEGLKSVIKGVSGCFKSGELAAIMGPSGAGKTSLLNILTGLRKAQGSIKCSSPSQGKKGAKQYSKHSCYILQDDCLDPLFTVEETMKFAAELKLGKGVPEKTKEFLIQEILDSLMLLSCRNTRCDMISGGQKKRLSVALELIGNPSVMFLDEPTTGLDSLSSNQMVRVLKTLAQQGRTIVCTIHQPSASLFEMFDFVYIMAEGKCVYQGSSRNVVSYLATYGLNCPQYHNPADYLLEVTNGEYGNFTDTLEIKGIENKWRNDVKQKSIQYSANVIEEEEEEDTHADVDYTPSEFFKLCVLIKKTYKKMARDWTISILKVLLHITVGLFLGLTFLNIGNDGSKMVTNVGFFLISIVYLCYTSLMPAVLKFPLELNILLKERYNNWYKLRTYYTAFLLVDIPMQFIFVLAYISGAYSLSAQPWDITRFSKVILVLFLASMVSSSMGIFFGTMVNPINGTFLGAITLCLMFSVAGFLILFTHMSSTMYWLSYISYISYAVEAMTQTLYGNNRPTIPCPEDVEVCLFTSSEDLLKMVGMDKSNFWVDVAFLFSNFVVLRSLAFCTLKKNLSRI